MGGKIRLAPFADFHGGAKALQTLADWKDVMKSLVLILSSILFLGTSIGCKEKLAGPVVIAAHTKACLAKSDLADGKSDKVITKCPACALSMDGSADYKAVIDGYEVHSCTSDCNEALQEDPNKMFKDMKCDVEAAKDESAASPKG